MALKFCQQCKTLMSPHKKEGRFFFKCMNCNLVQESDESILSTSEMINIGDNVGKGIMENENSSANYENKCRKCGYDKAEVIDMGIFYSDEDNLILLKCGKCGFSERVGRRTS